RNRGLKFTPRESTEPGAVPDSVLLVFGVVSLVSIWLTGLFIDHHLRRMMILSCALFAVAATAFGINTNQAWIIYLAAAVWGLAFGGAATLLQTASAEAADQAGDVAQSLVVTCWNIGIAGGGIVGGTLLSKWGPAPLPWAVLALVVPALIVTVCSYRHGFPTADRRRNATT
ncbi:MFS transporter, partial [Mycolicibacterium fortuitum]|uniref:MFS transporter n=1 Tax=Mycolicibacterium fortuitum TaxID=1766 RepID=UPI001CE16858